MIEREYQTYAIDSMFHYFENNAVGNPLIAAPTGVGKSIIIGGAIRRIFQYWSDQRVMCLTHVKELVDQNHAKMLAMWPNAPAGVYCAGLNKKEFHYPITFASIASVYSVASLFGHIDLVFIDEAHMVSLDEDAMYNQFMEELRKINSHVRVVGLTATPFKNGQGMLTEGEGALFAAICCDMTTRDAFNWFIDQGYLVNLLPGGSTQNQYNVEKVKIIAGEYDQGGLQRAVDKQEITERVVKEAIERAKDRHHWLVFAAGVKHTEHVAEMFSSLGISATFVHSKMRGKERDRRIKAFKAGEYQVMVNNGILTTGFDFPELDCIIMMRPTKSVGLWIQMLGRGTRPYYVLGFDLSSQEGRLESIKQSQKPNTLVLDFTNNTSKLGPINEPMIPKKKGDKPGDAPVKICPQCGMYNNASAIECFSCGMEFPRSLAISSEVSNRPLIAREEKPVVEALKVSKVIYNTHHKPGMPISIKVTYYCGLNMYHEWVALEHGKSARGMAVRWWMERANCEKEDVPLTVAEGLAQIDSLRIPTHINVWVNKQFPEIMGYEYLPT